MEKKIHVRTVLENENEGEGEGSINFDLVIDAKETIEEVLKKMKNQALEEAQKAGRIPTYVFFVLGFTLNPNRR